MIDESALRQMTQEQRAELARMLAAIDMPHPLRDPVNVRRRRVGLIVVMGICLIMTGWIVILIFQLPRDYKVTHWRGVWVGLDIAELAGFAGTWLAAWKQRQVLVFFMIFTGTLLLADAWFDVVLSYGNKGFGMSLFSAIVAEVPLAILLYAGARRLVRLSVLEIMRLEGVRGPVPPLWRVPLFADGLEETLPNRLRTLGARNQRGAMSQESRLSRLSQHDRR